MPKRPYKIPQEFIEKVLTANKIAIFTGADISAESSIPTLHNVQVGFQAQYNP